MQEGRLAFESSPCMLFSRRPLPKPDLLFAALICALVAGVAARAALHWERDIWVDEVFTGAIAGTGSVAALVRDCLGEIGGPVYYGFMWFWTKVFGLGNVSLRLPSLIASVAAPLLILWKGPGERTTRLVWGGAAAALIPLINYSAEARSYALLFFLGTAQAILLLKFLREPTMRLAVGWSAVSALLVLTHYHSGLLVAAQGLAIAAVLRLRLLRFWPAALPFVPVAAWMWFHIPFVLGFARPGIAWQSRLPLDLASLAAIANDLLGLAELSMALLIGTLAIVMFDARRGKLARHDRAALLVAGAGLAAAGAIVLWGFLQPSYHPRYLLPVIPGVLLAVALLAQRLQAKLQWLPAAILLLFATSAALEAQRKWAAPHRSVHGQWQSASSAIMAQKVTRIAFAYDKPMLSIIHPDLMARVGGFFFNRAGYRAQLVALNPDTNLTNIDANQTLPAMLDALPGKGRGALLWIYERADERPTMATQHPPSTSLDDRFECRNHAEDSAAPVVVLLCVER
jgi:hypothetical protein